VDVLEDLFEDLSIALVGLPRFWLQVSEVALVASVADVFQVGTTAEHAALASDHNSAYVAVAR